MFGWRFWFARICVCSLMRDLNWTPAGSVLHVALFPRIHPGLLVFNPLSGVEGCSVDGSGLLSFVFARPRGLSTDPLPGPFYTSAPFPRFHPGLLVFNPLSGVEGCSVGGSG